MIIKLLNNLLHKYMWCFERDNGDKGFVIALNREDAINKLEKKYFDARERILKTDLDDNWLDYDWMYLYDANHTEIDGDIFVNVPW